MALDQFRRTGAPEDIPGELVAMLDEAAGRVHSRAGSVLTALAAILVRYDEMLQDAGVARGRNVAT